MTDELIPDRMPAHARLITDVCAITDRPFVEAVESRFAGYFNELAIAVKLRADATDEDVIGLQNEFLRFFSGYELPADFTWKAEFMRGERKLRSLFPGDPPRQAGERLDDN